MCIGRVVLCRYRYGIVFNVLYDSQQRGETALLTHFCAEICRCVYRRKTSSQSINQSIILPTPLQTQDFNDDDEFDPYVYCVM